MAKSSQIIDSLTTNTLYSFHVRAKDTMGVWNDHNVAVNKTTTKDTSAPAVLSSITLLLLSDVFHLKWARASTLDLRGGGFKVYVFTADNNNSGSRGWIKHNHGECNWLGERDKWNKHSPIAIENGTSRREASK